MNRIERTNGGGLVLIRLPYEAPRAEAFALASGLHLLVNLSTSGGFDEFEPGDGSTEEFEIGEDV